MRVANNNAIWNHSIIICLNSEKGLDHGKEKRTHIQR